ncbi:unnamed protein product [Rotaria sordida]|uniref:Uncharacterized protein n=1 Tax=Rotaria sordida TaxID=392033 RepID=A0A814UKD3_9BILA|nr:unnamed protein product [Rotaria sordida]CAF1184403.1 unnamed protein product [Rotaria sordida]CAF1432231.1 unnamed protein product [Rotaria sordida]CAF1447273.1 unnamed protein product [Rotaria sordida]
MFSSIDNLAKTHVTDVVVLDTFRKSRIRHVILVEWSKDNDEQFLVFIIFAPSKTIVESVHFEHTEFVTSCDFSDENLSSLTEWN